MVVEGQTFQHLCDVLRSHVCGVNIVVFFVMVLLLFFFILLANCVKNVIVRLWQINWFFGLRLYRSRVVEVRWWKWLV